ncbi:MAG: TIR domain-containing protein [Hyphomicrobiaceae bacterium]
MDQTVAAGGVATARSDRSANEKLRVFVSYSRDDLAFAEQLYDGLDFAGFAPTLDRHGISGGEDWKERLGNLIRETDTVVFVVSPASAVSDICAWEVEEARRLGQRIIPVVCRPLGETRPPEALADLNYIYFYAEPKSPGSGFATGLRRLKEALDTDLDWHREHTRLLIRATEWEAGGRLASRLLSGSDIQAAKDWAARRPRTAPELTDLQREFIRASEDEATARASAERQRLADMAAAQEARAKALAEAEAALKRAAEEQRRRGVLRGVLLAVMTVAAVVSGWLFWQMYQRGVQLAVRGVELEKQVKLARESEAKAKESKELAQNEAKRADFQAGAARLAADAAKAATERAVKTRDEALLTQSRFLADRAMEVLGKGDAGTAALLALEALRDEKSDREEIRKRPWWPKAHVALDAAARQLREAAVLTGHVSEVTAVAFAPDGATLASSAWNTVRLWRRGADGGFAPAGALEGTRAAFPR